MKNMDLTRKKNMGFSMYDLVRYHCVFDGVKGGAEVSLDWLRKN